MTSAKYNSLIYHLKHFSIKTVQLYGVVHEFRKIFLYLSHIYPFPFLSAFNITQSNYWSIISMFHSLFEHAYEIPAISLSHWNAKWCKICQRTGKLNLSHSNKQLFLFSLHIDRVNRLAQTIYTVDVQRKQAPFNVTTINRRPINLTSFRECLTLKHWITAHQGDILSMKRQICTWMDVGMLHSPLL